MVELLAACFGVAQPACAGPHPSRLIGLARGTGAWRSLGGPRAANDASAPCHRQPAGQGLWTRAPGVSGGPSVARNTPTARRLVPVSLRQIGSTSATTDTERRRRELISIPPGSWRPLGPFRLRGSHRSPDRLSSSAAARMAPAKFESIRSAGRLNANVPRRPKVNICAS